MDSLIKINKKFLGILAILILLAFAMGASDASSYNVNLTKKGQTVQYVTSASNVGEFLKEKNLVLGEKDYINYSLDTPLENNMDLLIREPIEITVLDNGVESKISSGHLIVEEILEENGITLNGGDYTVPSLKAEINIPEYKEPLIVINRVDTKLDYYYEPVPFKTVRQENPELPQGQENVIQVGKNGTREITKETVVTNGGESKSKVVLDQVISQPVDEIIEVGTAQVDVAGAGRPAKDNIVKTITMNASAYDPSPASNGKWAGITSMGTPLRKGVVAVDPKVIPLGTKLYIESTDDWPDYGYAVAEDTGSAIKGNKIDLLFEDRPTCFKFGRRNVVVHILED